MFPIALACGNTFILKPPALVPSASVRLAELLKEAGLPDGVFNVVHCANEDAAQLCTDPRIRGGELRRLLHRGGTYLYHCQRARQAGTGLRRGEKPGDRHPGTPIWTPRSTR